MKLIELEEVDSTNDYLNDIKQGSSLPQRLVQSHRVR